MWARLLLVGVALAAPTVFAQTPAVGGAGQWRSAISGAIRGSTLDEVIQWSDTQFARNASVGRYVRWGGAVMIGGALTLAALDWYYNELKRESGTSLDNYMSQSGSGGALPPTAWVAAVNISKCYPSGYGYTNLDYGMVSNGGAQLFAYDHSPSFDDPSCNAQPSDLATARARQRYSSDHPGAIWLGPRRVRTVTGYEFNAYDVVAAGPMPSLPDYLRTHPDAASAVRDITAQYVDNHDPGSPSAPYPGVTLNPTPNPNQWTDNPYTDRSIDTDGDGWPDWMEKQRPWPDGVNDPQSHPNPSDDSDGDGLTNDTERQCGSDPYDPASVCPDTPTDPNKPGTKDDPSWPGAPGMPDLPQLTRPADPQLPEFTPDQIPDNPLQRAADTIGGDISRVRSDLMSRFPFGVVTWLNQPSVQDSGGCPTPVITVAGQSATVNICGNAVWSAMQSTLRPMLLGGLYVTIGFLVIRRVLDIQR